MTTFLFLVGSVVFSWLLWRHIERSDARREQAARRDAEQRKTNAEAKARAADAEIRESAKARAEIERVRVEGERIRHRDADTQDLPYEYQCVGHPNRTLALRYGIANLRKEIEPYTFYGRYGYQQ